MPASDKKKRALKIAFLTLLWVHFAGKRRDDDQGHEGCDAITGLSLITSNEQHLVQGLRDWFAEDTVAYTRQEIVNIVRIISTRVSRRDAGNSAH